MGSFKRNTNHMKIFALAAALGVAAA